MNKKLKTKRARGRPRIGSEKKARFQITLTHSAAATMRQMGGGNLSAGINMIAAKYHSADDLVDLNEWGILQNAPRSIAEATRDHNMSMINVHGELMAINERLNDLMNPDAPSYELIKTLQKLPGPKRD
jgi:hypothetical protein